MAEIQDEIKQLTHLNQRLLLLIGYASGFICQVERKTADDEKKYRWLMTAIENLVYLDKPLPPMP